MHELSTTDSSSDDEKSLNDGSKENDETTTDNVENTTTDAIITDVDKAQEAKEGFDTSDVERIISRSEILSIISTNRTSNQIGASMNVEALPEKNKRYRYCHPLFLLKP